MISVGHGRLDNGLRLVTVDLPHLHSACVSLAVRCGSRHEGLDQWGLSHLVEHMLFRGSARFPDSTKVARALERYGGTLQASTWRDHTQLWTPIHPSRLSDAVAVLADVAMRPRFADFDVERQIVEEELREDIDESGRDTKINNMSRASIWRGHPMGRRIAGSFESLSSFGLEEVRAHHAEHYVAENAVLCVAGPVKPDEARRLAERTFGEMPSGKPTGDGEAARFSPHVPLRMRRRPGTQLEIQLTFEALPDQHRDFAALDLLTRILDDGSSSRLQQAICERRGLVYELSTGLDCYSDCGLYDIEMKVAPRRAATALAAAFEALSELCEKGISDEEFELVRERALHDLEFSVDSSEELASVCATSALFGQTLNLENQISIINNLEPQHLQAVARSMFLSGRVHGTILGPVERANIKRIEKLFLGFPPTK